MIRILQVVPSLDINAGMMSVMMNYYRLIDRTRIQFDFLYLSETQVSHKEEILALGGRVFFLGNASFGGTYRNNLKAFFEEHRGEYCAVHCHPIWAPVLVGSAAKANGVKHIIAHSHSTKFSEKFVSAARNRAMMPLVKRISTDFVACCSQAAKKQLGKLENVFILKNAVDIKRYFFDEAQREKIRDELSISADDFVIGHAGRFSPEKNHGFMLGKFADIRKEIPNARLLLVGDGAMLEECKQIAQQLSLADSVIFIGKRQDMPALLSAMDVFWLPSVFEGVPLSAIEAQASGLPCVLSSVITKEVDFGNCKYISLNEPVQVWAEAFAAIRSGKVNRIENGKKLLGSSYDIESETENLLHYYLNFSD